MLRLLLLSVFRLSILKSECQATGSQKVLGSFFIMPEQYNIYVDAINSCVVNLKRLYRVVSFYRFSNLYNLQEYYYLILK